ncbi:type II toxin-antitoxin system VapC family toxin [Hyphomonas sp.]|uniref:type II toxin-antitoxin system VapC family toxin n=1 Tax=Hyphomonas sp. TaxID=87 RepID=UPI00391B308F
MILFDTSAWVDHFGPADFTLAPFLEAGRVMMHPFVLGEIALGSLSRRSQTLRDLSCLPPLRCVADEEVLTLIEARRLFARGIGLVDAHLLAAVIVTPPAELRTFDRRLAAVAAELGAGGLASEITA